MKKQLNRIMAIDSGRIFRMVFFFLILSNTLLAQESKIIIADTIKTDSVEIENMLEFPGSNIALLTYINNHLELNTLDLDENVVWGCVTIHVNFMVDTMGIVREVKIIKGSRSEKLNNRVVELFQSLPAFKPATKVGVPVNVIYTIPLRIRFN